MDECKYGKYCLCATCEHRLNKSSKLRCYDCEDCMREQKQVHDVWSCSRYERSIYLRKYLGKPTFEQCKEVK